jgi:hypothetical protein
MNASTRFDGMPAVETQVAAPPSRNGTLHDQPALCQTTAPSSNPINGEIVDTPERKLLPKENFRDRRGRFVRGNPGGPGNPFNRQIAGFRRAICRAVTQRDLAELALSLLERAKRGDDGAAALLLSYTVGRPTEAANPDTVDLEEWRLLQQLPVSYADLNAIIERLPPDFACGLVQRTWPVAMKQFTDRVRAMLAEVGAPAPHEAPVNPPLVP